MIAGALESLSIFKILRSVDAKRMSGTLVLRSGDVLKRFGFFKGNLIHSYSNRGQEHLSVHLRDSGLLSSIELADLSKKDSSIPKRSSMKFCFMGSLSPNDSPGLRQACVERGFFRALNGPTGNTNFNRRLGIQSYHLSQFK